MPGFGIGVGAAFLATRLGLTLGPGGGPANTLTLRGQPITLGGSALTLGGPHA